MYSPALSLTPFRLTVRTTAEMPLTDLLLRSPGTLTAAQLTPESIVRAMDAGDFYCSTGVTLEDIEFEDKTLTITIADEPGVTYTTQFIGTRRGYDAASHPVRDAEGKELRTTRRYSEDIGRVLAEQRGTTARYTLKGDEIYVRAKVISSRKNAKSHVPGECEAAWVQPVVAE